MKTEGARNASLPLDTILLDRGSRTPLARQLYQQLRNLILARTLAAEAHLPASRVLAKELDISRNTVVSALSQLETEGYIRLTERSNAKVIALPETGTVPSPAATTRLSARGHQMTQRNLHLSSEPGSPSLHPGIPDIREFPFQVWRKFLLKRLSFGSEDLFTQHYVEGHPALQETTAQYLSISRGVRCTPKEIVITSGGQAAFDIIARLILDAGDYVWMEEPGFYGARAAFEAAGARIVPLKVNENGWQLDEPVDCRPKLIYVTPQCQSPIGATMRLEQRLSLIEAARRLDALIVEDDFDGEYRFDGQPVPALQGSDPSGRTIYVGTFSKVLFPALRIGYIVTPALIAERFLRALFVTGQTPPLVMQAVLADFIEHGHFARHLRRTRRLYMERREKFGWLTEELIGDFGKLVQGSAGMQALFVLHRLLDDTHVVNVARASGISMNPLSRYYAFAKEHSGLILGYAALDRSNTIKELKMLRSILSSLRA